MSAIRSTPPTAVTDRPQPRRRGALSLTDDRVLLLLTVVLSVLTAGHLYLL